MTWLPWTPALAEWVLFAGFVYLVLTVIYGFVQDPPHIRIPHRVKRPKPRKPTSKYRASS